MLPGAPQGAPALYGKAAGRAAAVDNPSLFEGSGLPTANGLDNASR